MSGHPCFAVNVKRIKSYNEIMKLRTLVMTAFGAMLLASCSTSKTQLPYFTDIQDVAPDGYIESMEYMPTIKLDDELLITITSTNYPEATAQYNVPLTNPARRGELDFATTPKQQTFVVNSKGDITMPKLGTMHVAGLTVEQLHDQIAAKVQQDVSDAIVRVEIVNFTVIVAGEVSHPQTVKVNRNRFSVLDAISAAGDLTPQGERSNILVIREENGKRVYNRLDLNKAETLTSPYFYLQQNDYVYVEPNKIREDNAKYNQYSAYKLTIISTVVSAASVIASLVIALTVK